MLRSMYSGISGMKVNQVKLDVIGNNISNVGTTAFKSSRARFSDMMRQNVNDAMAPATNQGGTNASQVGLGVQLASIDTVMTQGMMQPTGRSLDVAIDGDGFFMVSKGPSVFDNSLNVNHQAGAHTVSANGQNDIMYSRDGSFILDRDGNLLTGDGFRVMGYSLTNDDNGMAPTGKEPYPANLAGIDIRFGPGSQLNNYKVVLGEIGPGTVTSLNVDKNNKQLVLNGDFSRGSSLNIDQIELAVNKGLLAAGISQEAKVSGKVRTIDELQSEGVVGGTDSTSPDPITLSGCTVTFDEGDELNGYQFNIEHSLGLSKTEATVDKNKKVITIKTDLARENGVDGKIVTGIVNDALKAAGVSQEVTLVGQIRPLDGMKVNTSGGVDAKAPELSDKNKLDIEVTFGGTDKFNGKNIVYQVVETANKPIGVAVKSSEIIVTVEKGAILDNKKLNEELKTALGEDYVEGEISFKFKASASSTNVSDKVSVSVGGGVTAKSPKKVDIRGLTFDFPEGEKYNDIQIVVGDVSGNSNQMIVIDGDDTKIKKITINADFFKGVDSSEVKLALDKALANQNIKAEIKVKGMGEIPSDDVKSDKIDGGERLSAPDKVSVFGMNLEFGKGASLNNYKFRIGTISKGTKTEAKVDTKNKTITINGDFTKKDNINPEDIESAIKKALKNEGIDQDIQITGSPDYIDGGESGAILGGTPIQSINEDGVVNFVNGGGDIKSYDENLKTLKIPDKVRIPGSNQELRVKTYSIDKNGIITGVLEDGRVAALGQIAMASFKNPEGLNSMGGNLYSGSVNSGEAVIKSGVGTLGDDNSKGYGDNLQGMLEMSNVDLAEQFTDMIVTTRAFQASGKMINTGDEILQDIINLKR